MRRGGASGVTEVVDDVKADDRYLACFVSTRSEIVVPIAYEGRVAGEIDIDSDVPAAFGPEDGAFLERVALISPTASWAGTPAARSGARDPRAGPSRPGRHLPRAQPALLPGAPRSHAGERDRRRARREGRLHLAAGRELAGSFSIGLRGEALGCPSDAVRPLRRRRPSRRVRGRLARGRRRAGGGYGRRAPRSRAVLEEYDYREGYYALFYDPDGPASSPRTSPRFVGRGLHPQPRPAGDDRRLRARPCPTGCSTYGREVRSPRVTERASKPTPTRRGS